MPDSTVVKYLLTKLCSICDRKYSVWAMVGVLKKHKLDLKPDRISLLIVQSLSAVRVDAQTATIASVVLRHHQYRPCTLGVKRIERKQSGR